ncbi:uncharacterized protein An02g12000 [Aspergillus niger]|uniref:Large ribosomal subunit protein mL53 n=2 Tax=Aspergillus niger TaxID=5061 RepID=A2QER7_ASPNC|nr:uncharacterized protein An02g12000 [Aspergillus niger]CAK96429.1 unnamed protein product [Aspergillus niger]
MCPQLTLQRHRFPSPVPEAAADLPPTPRSISLTQHHILPLYTSQHPQDRPTLQTTTTKTTAKMTIPLSTISTFRTTFNPFLRSARPCRLILSLLRNPTTTPASSPGHIDIKVTQLPRSSTQEPELTIGFKNGKELKIEVGKRQMKIGDVVEEIARVGRAIELLFGKIAMLKSAYM